MELPRHSLEYILYVGNCFRGKIVCFQFEQQLFDGLLTLVPQREGPSLVAQFTPHTNRYFIGWTAVTKVFSIPKRPHISWVESCLLNDD